MDSRAAKLALARKKLKHHQEKKVTTQKDASEEIVQSDSAPQPSSQEQEISFIECQTEENSLQQVETENETSNINKTTLNHGAVNVTEILISNKRDLECQIDELQSKSKQLENDHALMINNLEVSKQQIHLLEHQLKCIQDKYVVATMELQQRDNIIKELNIAKTNMTDQNNNLLDQLEFTKTMLTAKETENASLHSQLNNLQHQLDGTKLQLEQLTNGSTVNLSVSNYDNSKKQNEELLQKISGLEQQLKNSQKEKDQISMHYEHYVSELNEQLKSVVKKNEEMCQEINNLSHRESSLIEQISELEIRLQNYSLRKATIECQTKSTIDVNELQNNCTELEMKLQALSSNYEDMKKKYLESEVKIKELQDLKDSENCKQDEISITKLNADITSDKIAAQRATEQNKKLKIDMQELEEAFIKMSQDKLELTEKLTAEKFLNRELTIKLAEIEERANDMHTKLMAKDEEMIRLQTSYRSIEKENELLSIELNKIKRNITHSEKTDDLIVETQLMPTSQEENITTCNHNCENESLLNEADKENNSNRIQKEEAMSKLQDRFLKIMDEVADLSDEKHRLEHIILQLQNETDTICEYVALYQQQRSLLKKRDEERSAQIKIFQEACDKLKSQVEDLSNVLIKLSEDKELSLYFQEESRRKDLDKVKNLISHLKNNCLVDPKRKNVDFKNFYPCGCCSGKLIEV